MKVSTISFVILISAMAPLKSHAIEFTPREFLNTDIMWNQIGLEYNIDPLLLYAITLAESGIQRSPGYTSPWPYTLRSKNNRYYADTKEEAEKALDTYISKYGNLVDVGYGQINLRWNGYRVKEPKDLLDPETNLTVVAAILSEALRSTDDIVTAIGRYHSWNETTGRKYAMHVLKIYNNLKDAL